MLHQPWLYAAIVSDVMIKNRHEARSILFMWDRQRLSGVSGDRYPNRPDTNLS